MYVWWWKYSLNFRMLRETSSGSHITRLRVRSFKMTTRETAWSSSQLLPLCSATSLFLVLIILAEQLLTIETLCPLFPLSKIFSPKLAHSSSRIWMWQLDHKEGWEPKNWCFWITVLEETPKSPLDSKESKRVHPTWNQPWIFMGRTDAEADAPILCPPDMKSWLVGKYPDAGKDWGQEEKGMTEDEMIEWYHWLSGHEFEQTPGDAEGQGSLLLLTHFSRVRLCATP